MYLLSILWTQSYTIITAILKCHYWNPVYTIKPLHLEPLYKLYCPAMSFKIEKGCFLGRSRIGETRQGLLNSKSRVGGSGKKWGDKDNISTQRKWETLNYNDVRVTKQERTSDDFCVVRERRPNETDHLEVETRSTRSQRYKQVGCWSLYVGVILSQLLYFKSTLYT